MSNMNNNNYFDPGGSHSRNYPAINEYTHNSKRGRMSDDLNSQFSYSLYITFKICNSVKSLKLFSPFKVNDVLNTIAQEWKYISSNRERDIITILVFDKNNAEKFINTKSVNFGEEDLDVVFEAHSVLNYSKGTIFCPEIIKMSNEEIISSLKDQNVSDIYRFQKRNSNNLLIDSGLFILTFNGTNPPRNIKVAYLSVMVSTYYPSPRQCNHCFKLGHTTKQCKNSTLEKACVRCGSVAIHEECEFTCVNCRESHSNKYKGCNEYKKEKAIIKLKIDHNLSYPEARRRYVANRGANSFSEAAERGELVKMIENLNKKVDLLIIENTELTNANAAYSIKVNELKDDQNNDSIRNLQQKFDDFKESVKESTDSLNIQLEKQKKLHNEQIQKYSNNMGNLEAQLATKNSLLEDIHKYLLANKLYPENLSQKGIESLIKSNQKTADTGLEVSTIEIDDDVAMNVPSQATKKTARESSLNRLVHDNIKKFKSKTASSQRR